VLRLRPRHGHHSRAGWGRSSASPNALGLVFHGGPSNETERRHRAAPRTRPRVLTNKPWPPPLSGRGRVRFVETPRACCSRLAGLEKTETHAHAWFRLSTGHVRPVIALVVFSEVRGRKRCLSTLPKLLLTWRCYATPERRSSEKGTKLLPGKGEREG